MTWGYNFADSTRSEESGRERKNPEGRRLGLFIGYKDSMAHTIPLHLSIRLHKSTCNRMYVVAARIDNDANISSQRYSSAVIDIVETRSAGSIRDTTENMSSTTEALEERRRRKYSYNTTWMHFFQSIPLPTTVFFAAVSKVCTILPAVPLDFKAYSNTIIQCVPFFLINYEIHAVLKQPKV